jgi:hypothetical protein
VLTLVMVAACIVATGFAVVLEGAARTALWAAAFVFLITAAYCAGIVWLETREFPPIDIEQLPPVTPLPQSPVSEIYDPVQPANNRRSEPH